MGKLGKLLTISPTRSIYIEDQNGEYIKDNTIIYRNVGKNYDIKYQIQANVYIKDNVINVLDDSGNMLFFFPAQWLDTTIGKIIELQELGILK